MEMQIEHCAGRNNNHSAEREFLRSYLARAVHDLKDLCTLPLTRLVISQREDVIAWFRSEETALISFRGACEALGFDPELIHRALAPRIELAIERMENFGGLNG